MNDNFIPGAVIGTLIGICFGFLIKDSHLEARQSKTIGINSVEWVVDAKTGTTTFTWKEKQ